MFRCAFFLLAFAGTALAQIGPEVAVSPATLEPRLAGQARIATNGNGYLVIWQGGGTLRATRLDRNGNIVDATGFVIPGNNSVANAAVASAGYDYLVAWVWCDEIEAVVVSPDGSISPPKHIASLGNFCTGNLEIASNGASYLIAYDFGALLVDGSGNVLHPPISFPAGFASVASDGRDYVIAASAPPNVVAIPISANGEAGARFGGRVAGRCDTARRERSDDDARQHGDHRVSAHRR